MDRQCLAFSCQQVRILLTVHEGLPISGGYNVGSFTKVFQQLVLVRISSQCFDGLGVGGHHTAIHTIMLFNSKMVRDQWMSARHNVCLLSVNLWHFIDQEVPFTPVRPKGNSGEDL